MIVKWSQWGNFKIKTDLKCIIKAKALSTIIYFKSENINKYLTLNNLETNFHQKFLNV